MIATSILINILAAACLFLVVWGVLGRFLFKPYLALLNEREARTKGDAMLALRKREQSRERRQIIEERLRQARIEGISVRDSKIDEAKIFAQQIVSEAVEEARIQSENTLREIELLRIEAFEQLSNDSQTLSNLIVEKLTEESSGRVLH